jgi:hypothetical protein
MALLLACLAVAAQGQNCTTQAEMPATERSALITASQKLTQSIAVDDVQALQAAIAPQVASDASGILNAVSDAAAKTKGATFTVDNLYLLDATDVAPGTANVRFYCGVFNLPMHVTITLGSLPQARYALSLVHATGVPSPQQMAIIFAGAAGQWKLAGFSFRPLTLAGHDSLWYWKQARAYASKNEKWDAYFYYSAARYLATPVDYMASTNLDKLVREQQDAQPTGVPGARPMPLVVDGQTVDVTQMETSDALGGLDLVVRYNARDTTDLAAVRKENTAVMQALLQAHPELKDAFHGLWVYAVAPGQSPFGTELPMQQIP